MQLATFKSKVHKSLVGDSGVTNKDTDGRKLRFRMEIYSYYYRQTCFCPATFVYTNPKQYNNLDEIICILLIYI